MDLQVFRLTAHYYHSLLSAELHINEWVQERLAPAEPLFRFMSLYLDSSSLFNVLIPLMGVYRHDLLVRLYCVVGLTSALGSFEKWIYPELRPLWWLRELYASEQSEKPRVALQTFDLSCETSGGLPCAHSMTLTLFLMIVSTHLPPGAGNGRRPLWLYALIAGCTLCMWLSRLYLATEFLHQCLLGTYLAISTWSQFERQADFLYTRTVPWAVVRVHLLVGLAAAVYFVKLQLGLDPHWSVRQAFKWCPEPTYMRHEDSPIFLLARDLGILMGVGLSAPLSKCSDNAVSRWRRFAGIVSLELINYGARLATPKHHGRLAFLAYEFTRNALHALALIVHLPKLMRHSVT
ncbi:hypothetical protein KR222_008384 [Zaprionus bogoriensis]|nr:hypothetical protein KR222_008384 [Zaprionus bogoriensis]